MADSGLGAAFRKLRDLGFIPVRSRGATRCFEGALACRTGPVRVRIEVSDWDFTEYPTIRLLEFPPFLPKLIPHVDATGGFCYFAPGAVVLDRYRRDNALWQCLDQARLELDRLSTNPTYQQGEFQAEFGANWYLGQSPLPHRILLGGIAPKDSQVGSFLVGQGSGEYVVVASDPEEVRALCDARGWPEPTTAAATCWIVRSGRMPMLPMKGLPRTVGEMFDWIKEWDRAAYGTIQKVLGQPAYLAQPSVLFVVQCGAGWFGFQVGLDASKRKGYRRKPTLYRQFFHQRGRDHALTRLAISEFGSDYVHSRNLNFPSLKDRRITLIGCGAIGGYLAQALAKLGAGSGPKGRLTLVDPDILTADNIGRHMLGFESLFQRKAEALKRVLKQQLPSLFINANSRAALLPSDLNDELVIDATGEEAVSEALNHHRLQLPAVVRSPMLHVWITGNGECTQGLWVDLPNFACFRCLRRNDDARTKRFVVLPEPPATRVIGCQAFTPYAVSAPMTAAALAIDMIIAWMNGAPTPRFRTRTVEATTLRSIKNQDLRPLDECPACAKRS